MKPSSDISHKPKKVKLTVEIFKYIYIHYTYIIEQKIQNIFKGIYEYNNIII